MTLEAYFQTRTLSTGLTYNRGWYFHQWKGCGGIGSQMFPLYVLFLKYLPELVKSSADFLQFSSSSLGEILHVTVIRILRGKSTTETPLLLPIPVLYFTLLRSLPESLDRILRCGSS
jgi:hypothetical protein